MNFIDFLKQSQGLEERIAELEEKQREARAGMCHTLDSLDDAFEEASVLASPIKCALQLQYGDVIALDRSSLHGLCNLQVQLSYAQTKPHSTGVVRDLVSRFGHTRKPAEVLRCYPGGGEVCIIINPVYNNSYRSLVREYALQIVMQGPIAAQVGTYVLVNSNDFMVESGQEKITLRKNIPTKIKFVHPISTWLSTTVQDFNRFTYAGLQDYHDCSEQISCALENAVSYLESFFQTLGYPARKFDWNEPFSLEKECAQATSIARAAKYFAEFTGQLENYVILESVASAAKDEQTSFYDSNKEFARKVTDKEKKYAAMVCLTLDKIEAKTTERLVEKAKLLEAPLHHNKPWYALQLTNYLDNIRVAATSGDLLSFFQQLGHVYRRLDTLFDEDILRQRSRVYLERTSESKEISQRSD